MLTALLFFCILGLIFRKLFKLSKKASVSLQKIMESERFYRKSLLDSVQSIEENVRQEEADEPDTLEELRQINSELKDREEQRRIDRQAVEKLIDGSDQG